MSSSRDSDVSLFRSTVGSVERVKHNRVIHSPKRPKPIPKKRLEDEEQVLEDMFSAEFGPEQMEVDNEETLSYARTGVQHGIIRKLKRGQYSIEAELDMHGMTVAIAKPALAEFIHRSQSLAKRCVKIIHGKGYRSPNQQPVLKAHINRWLRRSDAVIAFSSARQIDGGTGAVYVLLKQKR